MECSQSFCPKHSVFQIAIFAVFRFMFLLLFLFFRKAKALDCRSPEVTLSYLVLLDCVYC